MNENNDNIIPGGPFKGKKIEFASTVGIDMFIEISEEFMKEIFNFEPGEYLITDESSLHDFTGVDEMESDDIHNKIREIFDIDISRIESGNLFQILRKIHHMKYGNPS